MPIVSKEADLTQPRPFPCLALDHVCFLGETFIWCLYHLWSWLPGIESFGVDWGARGRQLLLPLPLPLPGLNELRAPVASHSGAVCYLENSRAAPARGRKNACLTCLGVLVTQGHCVQAQQGCSPHARGCHARLHSRRWQSS